MNLTPQHLIGIAVEKLKFFHCLLLAETHTPNLQIMNMWAEYARRFRIAFIYLRMYFFRLDIIVTVDLYKYFWYGRIWGYDIEFNSELIIVSTLRVYFEWHDNLSTCQVNNFCCIKLRMCVRQKNCAMKYSYITIAYFLCCIHSKKWKCYL